MLNIVFSFMKKVCWIINIIKNITRKIFLEEQFRTLLACESLETNSLPLIVVN